MTNEEAFTKLDNEWRRGDVLQLKDEWNQWSESFHKHPAMVPIALIMRNTYRIKPQEEE